jgi:hypothetical protein
MTDLFEYLAAVEDSEVRAARRVEVDARREVILPRKYAIKFRLDADGAEPTDANLERVLQWCALRPRSKWYPAIRAQVFADREEAIR